MLNCLVNSIFHILFCVALAKVLKSAARSPGSSVCHLCLPLFFFITIFFLRHLIRHEKIFLAGNSDSAMIGEAFQFIAFSLCWDLDARAAFSHSAPCIYTTTQAKNAWAPNSFITIKKSWMLSYLYIYMWLYRVKNYMNVFTFSCILTCHRALMGFFSRYPGLTR